METDLDLGDFFMDYWIIGDVHACYFTLTELLKIWQPENENLIFVGDLVNKGKYSEKVVEKVMQLQQNYPNQIIVIKGNHELIYLKKAYKHHISNEIISWIEQLPLYWENESFLVSHAGISHKIKFPEEMDESQISHRKALQNIGKRQFLGHNVVDEPLYDLKNDAWYLDTGAGFKQKLTALKVNPKGEILQMSSVDVLAEDFE